MMMIDDDDNDVDDNNTRVDFCDASLLGATLFHVSGLDKSWNGCCDDLARAAERLRNIGCQDALILLRSSISASKVLHLRCASAPRRFFTPL